MRANSLSLLISTLLLALLALVTAPNSAQAQPEAAEIEEPPEPEPDEPDDKLGESEPVREPRIPYEEEALSARRERRHILHNTLSGPVGGVHVVDAGSGADRTLRVALSFGGFATRGWLDPNQRHSNVIGGLALSWSPTKFLEIYGASSAWRNSNIKVEREYFQVPGDWTLGAKAFYSVLPWLTLGGDASLRIPLNTVLGTSQLGQSVGSALRANLTADLRELDGREGDIPLIIRLNAGYRFNRSSALVAPMQQGRYEALAADGLDPRPESEEDRHLISRSERFGLQIDQFDSVPLGLGFEAPISLRNGTIIVSPIAEWLLDIPIDRGRYTCRPAGEAIDRCVDQLGFAAYRQSVVFGLRVMPPLRGLSLFTAVEIGVTGVNHHAQELSAQAPYRVLAGISYAWDPKWEALTLRR